MKRLCLTILACVTLFATSSCEKGDADAWIYGTWQAVNISGETTSDKGAEAGSLDVTDFNATISFDATKKAHIYLPAIGDNEAFDVTYDYSIHEDRIVIGDFDLTYEFADEKLKIYGQGRFLIDVLFPFYERNYKDEEGETHRIIFTLERLSK